MIVLLFPKCNLMEISQMIKNIIGPLILTGFSMDIATFTTSGLWHDMFAVFGAIFKDIGAEALTLKNLYEFLIKATNGVLLKTGDFFEHYCIIEGFFDLAFGIGSIINLLVFYYGNQP